MKKTLGLVIILIVIAVAIIGTMLYMDAQNNPPASAPAVTQNPKKPEPNSSFTPESFQNIKSPHYVSSNPGNNQLLDTPVSQVVINFNFDVVPPSKITVTRAGENVTAGETTFSSDKLSMSVPVNADKTGSYKVVYSACWPDKSCHDGSFGFSLQLE